MKAAEKTIEFVKEWINGTFSKRSYQNYYIVKTPNAQFLMKSTEQRELIAIRDLTGHIYLFDSDLNITTYGAQRLIENDRALSNPLICLIYEGFTFKYTRVSPATLERASVLGLISKWKTLDRVEVTNPSLSGPIYLSLVEIGDKRYYITPGMSTDNNPNKIWSLIGWAQHGPEQKYKFTNQWPQYGLTTIYSNKVNKVNELKDDYVTLAGEAASNSWVNEDGWVFIPTEFESIEEITGRPFKAAKRTRPNPYAYGISGVAANLNNLNRRFETVEENAQALKQCVNIRTDITSSDWKDIFRTTLLPEIAEDFIAYFEADDAWLREHFEIAQAGALESQLRAKISMNLAGSSVYINREPNISPLSEYVIYVKTFVLGEENAKFMKILPSPSIADKIKGVFDGYN